MDDLFKWLFILGSIWLYVCNLVSCEDAFYFPQHPRFPDNVVEGQRLVVNCQVSETASIVYYWQQNGRNIDNTFRRYHNVSSLVFEIVHRQRDVGEYQCTAFNTSSGHTVSSSIAQLNVSWIGQDAKVALLSPKNIEEIHEGNSLTLKCIIEGNKYHVRWYKNSVRVSLDERIRVDPSQQTLNIQALSVSDNGVYSCDVALVANDKASAATITVLSTKNFPLIISQAKAPTIRILPQDITVNRGAPAQLDCVYDNALRVAWFDKDNSLMRNSTGKVSHHVVFPNGTLYFRNVRGERDAGVYRCVPVIKEGPDVNEAPPGGYIAYLKIAVRPELDGSSIFPQPTKDDKYVVRAGAALEAYCRPRNHENVNPSAVVTWVNGNKEQISDSPFLFISQIQTNQAGQYFCRAENGFGQSEYAISVVVTVMPVISQEPSNVRVEEEKTFRMSCGFKGSAGSLTNISWHRVTTNTNVHFQRILTSSRIQISNQDASMSYLQVLRANADDDNGVYRCQVTTLGFDPVLSENATVFIRERLKFITKPINQHLELNSKARILCRAHASGDVSINWTFLNGTKLPSHVKSDRNGTLVFDTVKKTDEGWYNCTATSVKEKPISVSIKVDVGVAPKFTVKPKDHVAIIGEMVVLDCQAEGDPTPVLNWDKDGKDNITELGRWQMKPNGSLVLESVKPGDRGRYGCTAGNKGRLIREEVELDVQETPSSVTQTLTLTISCAAGYILFVVVLIVYCKRSRSKKREPESSAMSAINTSQVTLQPNAYSTPESQSLLPKLPSHPPSLLYTPHLYEKNPSGSDPASSAYSSAANSCTISRRHLINLRKVGKGSFGDVFLAGTADSGFSVVTVKTLDARDEEVRSEFMAEFEMFRKLDHGNVIKSIGLCPPGQMKKELWAVYEHSQAGDLKYFVQTNADIVKKGHLVSFAHQVASGMEYLTRFRYIHRDLATRNCIVDLPDGVNPVVKVANLSVCSQGLNDGDYFLYRNRRIPLRWISAEALFDDEYSVKSDVWSFGVLLFELLTRCQMQPYEDITDAEVLRLLTEEQLPALISKGFTQSEQEMIQKCTHFNAALRPTFGEILLQWKLFSS